MHKGNILICPFLNNWAYFANFTEFFNIENTLNQHTAMLEFLDRIDTALFYFINTDLQNPFFDWFMPFITERSHWFPVWGVLIILIFWKGGKQGRIMLLLIIPLIVMSDQLSSSVFKPLFGRIRPCIALENVHMLVDKSISNSFPSSHAANFFALATFFSYFYRKYTWYFILIASLVSISRVSVGVHYPFDVLGGAVLGALCAFTIISLWRLYLIIYHRFRKS